MNGMSTDPTQLTGILIAVFTVLFTIALAVERLIVMAKPLFDKIEDATWAASAKILAAILLGFGTSYLFNFDMLAALGLEGIPPVAGHVAAGLASSVGSSALHAILEWMKTLGTPANTVTMTAKTDPGTSITATSKTTTPPA